MGGLQQASIGSCSPEADTKSFHVTPRSPSSANGEHRLGQKESCRGSVQGRQGC